MKKRHRIRFCAGVLAVLAAAFAIMIRTSRAYKDNVPVGSWYGTFVSPTGKRGALRLDIAMKRLRRKSDSYGDGNGHYIFEGMAQLCFEHQGQEVFSLHDGLMDSHGLGFDPELQFVRGPPAGLHFSDDLHGVWQKDTLTMTGHLESYIGPDVGQNPDKVPTVFTMVKGDDRHYADSCAALGALPT